MQGNEYFSEANGRRAVPSLQEGQTPNSLAIARSPGSDFRAGARYARYGLRTVQGRHARLRSCFPGRLGRPWTCPEQWEKPVSAAERDDRVEFNGCPGA